MRKSEYIRARKILRNPKNWNQSHYSVDSKGKECLSSSEKATRWCALTACNLFAKDINRDELKLAALQLGFTTITSLNDNGTHAEVIKAFDLAISFCDIKIKEPSVVGRWLSYTPLSETF